jgi:hypothetical protein
MVQVDVFWSYGLASGLTLAGRRRLKNEKKFWVNPVFLVVVLWISLLFAPSGAYLLWAFPYWETMFVARTHTDIPAWLVVIFSITNVSQGILGYYVTARLIQAGKDAWATAQPVIGHALMLYILIVGWDGSGFRRFTYAGTGDQWAQGVPLPWTDFFSSPVFYTLLGMGVILVPTYAWHCVQLRGSRSFD